jgi:hypothetical protein
VGVKLSIQSIGSPQSGILHRLWAVLRSFLWRTPEPPTEAQLKALMGGMTEEQFQDWCDRQI